MPNNITKLVLLRHGESAWNRDNRFAGWTDVSLTMTGIEQARQAGLTMRDHRLEFDVCFTSVLKRATHTAWHCLDAMDRTWLPTIRSWRLNERHYGALHGLSKSATVRAYGEEQVRLWRRSYETKPPAQSIADTQRLAQDPRYASAEVPPSESLQDAVARILTCWEDSIRPSVSSGARGLIVGHGTTLRAFVKILTEQSGGSGVARLEVPNGVPLVFELDRQLSVIQAYYLNGKKFFD